MPRRRKPAMSNDELNERQHVPIPVVLDTDAGIDDAVALALAAKSPELAVLAVTTTYGNTRLAAATRNARFVLRLAGRPDIPVFPGADAPLTRPLTTAPEIHGTEGVGDAPVPPAQQTEAIPDRRCLLNVLAAAERPVTLVTLGPLTNLALALSAEKDLVRTQVARHLGVFGSLRERGAATRWADFNAWCDPDAAHLVLRAGLDTVLVGLDVTRLVVLSATEIERLPSSPEPLVHWLGQTLRYYSESLRREARPSGCVVNDVLPVVELVAPGTLRCSRFALDIDLGDGEDRGRTYESPGGVPTMVATGIDVDRARRLLVRVLGEYRQDNPRSGGSA